ncbi:PEPxxWA-CTERM sorting domain-containing protein [Erythrobacter sp. SD-21]|uniref:PEPxxWA-CTERM sorting domain-containing protein n=1 Tax=Erythrobacter sp. SD-21 TaxID=161528 RepID=UPI000A038DA4
MDVMVIRSLMSRARGARWRALAGAALLVGGAGLSILTPIGSSTLTAMQQAGDDLQDFLARSPGERGLVIGSKGKGKGLAFVPDPGRAAEDEVLGKVFDLPGEEPGDEVASFVPTDESPAVPLATAPPSLLIPGGFVPGFNTPPGGGVGFTPPGGGGTGGTPPGNPPPGNPPPGGGNPPVGAVPEPSTWALMILGFMFAGGAMRRRNRLARAGHLA